jgi:hypothetical protein
MHNRGPTLIRMIGCCMLAASLPGICQPSGGRAGGKVIGGFFFRGETGKPIPGALVALYSADDNILLEQTYTIDSGSFTLRAPEAGGRFYIVATKDTMARREDFEYDPGRQPRAVMINYQDSRGSAEKAWSYASTKLDYVVTAFLGFLLGLATKRYEDRKLFRIHINRFTLLRDDILTAHARLTQTLQKYLGTRLDDDTSQRRIRADYEAIIGELGRPLEEFEPGKLDSAVVYAIRKKPGLEDCEELRLAIKGIKTFAGERFDDIVNATEEARQKKLEPFEKLRNNRLLQG